MHYMKNGFHFPYSEYFSRGYSSKFVAFCVDIGCACVDLDFCRAKHDGETLLSFIRLDKCQKKENKKYLMKQCRKRDPLSSAMDGRMV